MLSIEDAATRSLVVEAVLKAIPPERRDQLVKEALSSLLVPKGTGGGMFGEKTSTLEDAFKSATYDMARRHAEEWLKTDPKFANAVKDLTSGVVEKMLEPMAREKILSGIVGAVTQAFENAARNY